MGRDKALISYNGNETQLERSTALLKAVCQEVFVSQRKDQAYEIQNFANVNVVTLLGRVPHVNDEARKCYCDTGN